MSDNYDEQGINESSESNVDIERQNDDISKPAIPVAPEPRTAEPAASVQVVQSTTGLVEESRQEPFPPRRSARAVDSSHQGYAIASLVLGICSITLFLLYFLTPILGVLGLIFGIIAVRKSVNSGKNMAIAGIATSSVGLAISLLLWVLLIVIISSFTPFIENFEGMRYDFGSML